MPIDVCVPAPITTPELQAGAATLGKRMQIAPSSTMHARIVMPITRSATLLLRGSG